MPALGTFQYQSVLAELIAQFIDVKAGRHGADCCRPKGPASIQFKATADAV
jgi:hypothetical protein